MSIRTRLTRLLLLFTVPLALAVGVGLFLFVRAALIGRFDESLMARARALAGMVKLENGAVELDLERDSMPEYATTRTGQYFELWALGDGAPARAIERSASLEAAHLTLPRSLVGSSAWDSPLWTAEAGRCAALLFTPHAEGEGEPNAAPAGSATDLSTAEAPTLLIVVAQSRHDLDRTLALLAAALVGAGFALTVGSLIAVRAALARGLAPVDDLARQVARIGPEDWSQRLEQASVPLELAPIAQRTNELLNRLAGAIDRERRLAASAAHELRTPIAEIRAATELALSRARAPDEYRRTLDSVLAAADRMGLSADAVLRLARVQSGREQVALEPVDLHEALLPMWMRWMEPLVSRQVRAVLQVPMGTRVRADPAMLRVILENLCANAAERTPAGAEIRAQCTLDPAGMVAITLRNPLGPSHDEPPAPDGHAGLGLLSARAMAEALGGSLQAGVEGDCFVATLRLLQSPAQEV